MTLYFHLEVFNDSGSSSKMRISGKVYDVLVLLSS